jgi:hypothetical protein
MIAEMVNIVRDAKSRVLSIGPIDHDQMYDRMLAAATRFLSAVNYIGNEALPISPCHPVSSSSSASTGHSYQASSSFSRPPFSAHILGYIRNTSGYAHACAAAFSSQCCMYIDLRAF